HRAAPSSAPPCSLLETSNGTVSVARAPRRRRGVPPRHAAPRTLGPRERPPPGRRAPDDERGGLRVRLKVMTVVGTRPELIRLSRVIARLDATVDHVLVHTGQNYDWSLNEVFFRDLGIRQPDHLLGVDTSSLGRVLGETLIRTEEVIRQEA